MLEDEGFEDGARDGLFLWGELGERLELKAQVRVRPPLALLEDERIEADMQRAGEADQGVECGLGRPCLVAADLVDMQADEIGQALLGMALLLAELGQAGGKVHRDQPWGDDTHTVAPCAPTLLTHTQYPVVCSNSKRARNST